MDEIREIVGWKYHIQFEQSAVKGILGFKVDTYNNDLEACKKDAQDLLKNASAEAKNYNGSTPNGGN
jgi:hypothetical protein